VVVDETHERQAQGDFVLTALRELVDGSRANTNFTVVDVGRARKGGGGGGAKAMQRRATLLKRNRLSPLGLIKTTIAVRVFARWWPFRLAWTAQDVAGSHTLGGRYFGLYAGELLP
jgi:hypothetical protein